MAVKFISHVEADGIGGWYIKLKDTLEDNEVICKDLDEYKIKLEEMAAEYGNDIEVQWKRSKLLTPANIQEIQEKMDQLQKDYQDEIDQLNNNEVDFPNRDFSKEQTDV